MSSRPGTIREIMPVDLPRSRTDMVRGSAEFGTLVERIWTSIKPDALRASGAYSAWWRSAAQLAELRHPTDRYW